MDLGARKAHARNAHARYKELRSREADIKYMLHLLKQMDGELQVETLQLNSIIEKAGGDPSKSTESLGGIISSEPVPETENLNEAETESMDEAEAVNQINLDLGVGRSNDAGQDSSGSESDEEFEMGVDEMDLPVDMPKPKRIKTADSDPEMLDLNTYYGIDSQGEGPVDM